MEVLKENPLLDFHPDTLEAVRKLYNLDKPGVMREAIDILDSWIKQQNHFTKKDFNRDYLERYVIRSKGSVERAKDHLDKMCASRTLVPHFFSDCDVNSPYLANIEDIFLPKLTKDYYRVYFVQNCEREFTHELFNALYKRIVYKMEYICMHDYACGIIIVADLRKANLFELVKHINITDLAHWLNLLLGGFGFRLKGFYFITTSKFVDSLLTIMKSIASKKIGERIQVLKNIEELHDHVDKDILPEEYGGTEVSRKALHEKWQNVIGSEEYKLDMDKINEAKTNEELRLKDSQNYQMGLPGTFRSLKVD
ncbi:hypothetical protein evm_007795 [Chilo suppressalis]|nr:hypothetical protein evm_007795 [Chilo suppressalis]